MNKKTKNRIDDLISKGKSFTFENNSETTPLGTFTKASVELRAWIALVENFIKTNYGSDSGPFKLYDSHFREFIINRGQSNFTNEMDIIVGSLEACKESTMLINKNNEESSKLAFLKNSTFWAIVITVSGISFTLGNYFGQAKFDKEKNEFYQENLNLKKNTIQLKKENTSQKKIIETLKNQ